jgi:hypothetical protein
MSLSLPGSSLDSATPAILIRDEQKHRENHLMSKCAHILAASRKILVRSDLDQAYLECFYNKLFGV